MMVFKDKRGGIFIFVIWVVAILSIFGAYVGYVANGNLNFVKKIEVRDKLRYVGYSGAQRTINDFLTGSAKNNKLLYALKYQEYLRAKASEKKDDIEKGLSYNYFYEFQDGKAYCAITDEESKININRADLDVIRRLLEYAGGLADEPARDLAVSIMDWRDKDNERPGLNVVNNEDLSYKLANYPYTPKNDSFQTKEELLLIIGMTPEIYRKIEPYITLFGSGKIGINTASEVVLRATGLDASVVDKIMRFRTFDLASGAKMFRVFTNPVGIASELNDVYELGPEEYKKLDYLAREGVFAINPLFFSIKCVARVYNENLKIECVVNRKGTIKAWCERFENV